MLDVLRVGCPGGLPFRSSNRAGGKPHIVPVLLPALLARSNVHYRWVAVATTFVTMLATAAASGVFRILSVTFFVCGLSTNGLIQTQWVAL